MCIILSLFDDIIFIVVDAARHPLFLQLMLPRQPSQCSQRIAGLEEGSEKVSLTRCLTFYAAKQ